MSGIEIGLLGLAVMLVLMLIRIPIAIAMMAVGLGGYSLLAGVDPALNYLKTGAFWRFSSYDLAIIPMFLLMGEFAAGAGLSNSLFKAANAFFGHRRGGMAVSVIGACAGFGAICGSSLATVSTMTRVALPELRSAGYSLPLATGALAAGGTLGILIPPSVALVIYAIIVEANIVALFAAAMIPALFAAIGFMLAIEVYIRLVPNASPKGIRFSWGERGRAVLDTWTTLLIFLLVIGGIYIGWFTPSEAAAVGVFGTGLLAFTKGKMRWPGFSDAILRTARATAMIFLIILGAEFLNSFLALTRVSYIMAETIQASGLSPYL
ncbi:MAG: C4-dicarboxylate ABC transporter permease, partial [Alcaligenaceae bacterium]|nr:C4-dicarboxylate ABC transporter permease [Alcaligenaceae bacterium]